MNSYDFSNRDEAGKLVLLVTVRQKPSLTDQQFLDYWAGVHGVIISTMPGIFQYRQIPVGPAVSDIWTLKGNSAASSHAKKYEGFGEFTFPSKGKFEQFVEAVVPFAKADNANAFVPGSEDFLGIEGKCRTFIDRTPEDVANGTNGRFAIVVLLRRKQDVALDAFQTYLWSTLSPSLAKAGGVLKVRLNLFDVDVSQPVEEQTVASLELVFNDKLTAKSFFRSEEYGTLETEFGAKVSELDVYPVRGFYTLVQGAKRTLVGYFGPKTAGLVEDLGAINVQDWIESSK